MVMMQRRIRWGRQRRSGPADPQKYFLRRLLTFFFENLGLEKIVGSSSPKTFPQQKPHKHAVFGENPPVFPHKGGIFTTKSPRISHSGFVPAACQESPKTAYIRDFWPFFC